MFKPKPTKFSKHLESILSGYKNVNIAAGNNTGRVVYSTTLSEQKTFDFYDEFITEAELQKTFNEHVIIIHDEVILSKVAINLILYFFHFLRLTLANGGKNTRK